jgi:hypothetical protein
MRIPDLVESGPLAQWLPQPVRRRLESFTDNLNTVLAVHNPRVMAQMAPSAMRGLFLKRGRSGEKVAMRAGHAALFDFAYPADSPELRALYAKAKRLQWDAARDLDWSIDVDPHNPEVPLLPEDFVAWDVLDGFGAHATPAERRQVLHETAAWMLSQFLHGEQGALFAAAQVTEAVPSMDGKLYGATQVMDEARHVEVFHRYVTEKLERLWVINDNLFTIIDSLMTDGRWDMKFLGMQIMVEGLALGAFGMFRKVTKEPLLAEMLRRVIQDEARHVHYGVLALREHFTKHLSDREKREREDWAFEVAVLMRNRFLAQELYDERYSDRLTWAQWIEVMERSPGMNLFRTQMFSRLVPNLREIGLMPPRMLPHYERMGLARYFRGRSALQMNEAEATGEAEESWTGPR